MGSTMIRVLFPNPADSPTGRTPLKLSYSLTRDDAGQVSPVLRYSHGSHQVTRETWQAWQASGATIEADARGQSIVRQVLGLDAMP